MIRKINQHPQRTPPHTEEFKSEVEEVKGMFDEVNQIRVSNSGLGSLS